MGCVPSKSTSTVHPTNSSNGSVPVQEQVASSDHLPNRTVLVQEFPDPPSSTPEPVDQEQVPEPLETAKLQKELQRHVRLPQNSSNTQPKLQRQPTISPEDENVHIITNGDQGNAFNTDSSDSNDIPNSVDNVPCQWDSNVAQDEHFSRPPWSMERPRRSNPTLHLYGTDSQIEFFKMLDKKIEEGPDLCEESESDKNS